MWYNNQISRIYLRKLKSDRILPCTLKLIQALPGITNKVTEEEVNTFLESKLNLQLATIDDEGYPSIQPLWFLYDLESRRIYISQLKKLQERLVIYLKIPIRFTSLLMMRISHIRG